MKTVVPISCILMLVFSIMLFRQNRTFGELGGSMIFLSLWLLLAWIAGYAGASRKFGYWNTFFISFLVGPILGVIIALFSVKKSTLEFQQRSLENQERLIELMNKKEINE
jgi:uncharacterized membrane protein YhdT